LIEFPLGGNEDEEEDEILFAYSIYQKFLETSSFKI